MFLIIYYSNSWFITFWLCLIISCLGKWGFGLYTLSTFEPHLLNSISLCFFFLYILATLFHVRTWILLLKDQCHVSRTVCGYSPGYFIPYWVSLSLLGLQCYAEYRLPCLRTWQNAKLGAVVLFSWLDSNLYISTCWFWQGSCFQQTYPLNSGTAACITSIGPTA